MAKRERGRPQREFGRQQVIAQITIPEHFQQARFFYYLKRAKKGYILVMRRLRGTPDPGENLTPQIALHLYDIKYPKNCVLCLKSNGEIVATKGKYPFYHYPQVPKSESCNIS